MVKRDVLAPFYHVREKVLNLCFCMMPAVGFVDTIYHLSKFTSITKFAKFSVGFLYLSQMGVSFCQILFLHLLIQSCDFYFLAR